MNVLKELLSIFRAGNPLEEVSRHFTTMLKLAIENLLVAGEIYFGRTFEPEERSRIYETDVEINKLERAVRRRVAVHLAVGGHSADIPYALMMMSLVKDVERLGDYAKNLTEVVELHTDEFPDNAIVKELREIRREVETTLKAAPGIFDNSDREAAVEHILAGKGIAHRCDTLITKVAASDHDAATTTALVLGARYYKRAGGHMLNILSSVVMPLHKVDYFDEDAVPEFERTLAESKSKN